MTSAAQTPLTMPDLDALLAELNAGGHDADERLWGRVIAAARLGITNSGVIDDALTTALAAAKDQITMLQTENKRLGDVVQIHETANERAIRLGRLDDRVVEDRTARAIADWIQGDEDRPQMQSVRVAEQIRRGEWRTP